MSPEPLKIHTLPKEAKKLSQCPIQQKPKSFSFLTIDGKDTCSKEFTFWIFVIMSDIHPGVGAHCFGADKFSDLPSIGVNSLFSFVAIVNPSNTVSIHCCKHK